jgi:hypothetical protein
VAREPQMTPQAAMCPRLRSQQWPTVRYDRLCVGDAVSWDADVWRPVTIQPRQLFPKPPAPDGDFDSSELHRFEPCHQLSFPGGDRPIRASNEVLNQFAAAQQMLSPNDTSFRTHVTAQTVEFERGEMDQAFLMSGALSDSAYGSATGLEGPLHILTAARSPRDPTGWWRRC